MKKIFNPIKTSMNRMTRLLPMLLLAASLSSIQPVHGQLFKKIKQAAERTAEKASEKVHHVTHHHTQPVQRDRVTPPRYPGGQVALDRFVRKQLRHSISRKMSSRGIHSGYVFVRFHVSRTGRIRDARVTRSSHRSLEQEALRIVDRFPLWHPARRNGRAIDTWHTCKLHFTFNRNTTRRPPYRPSVTPRVHQRRVMDFTETMPVFPGGILELPRYIRRHVQYPYIARRRRIEGRVYVRFIVNEYGRVTSPTILRGIHPSLNDEALRVVRAMPRWTPGYHRGRPVSVYYIVPVDFYL